MLRKSKRLCLSVLLIFAILCGTCIPAAAAEEQVSVARSSAYISTYSASISASKGTIKVSFSITGMKKMTSIGATVIKIKDSNDNIVKTFYASSTSGMLDYNTQFHSGSVSYSGATSGTSYCAVVTFKAANSSGSDSATYTTGYKTA